MMKFNEQRPGIGKTSALLSNYRRHWWQLWKPKFPGLNIVASMKASPEDMSGYLVPDRGLLMFDEFDKLDLNDALEDRAERQRAVSNFMHKFFAPPSKREPFTHEEIDIIVSDENRVSIYRVGEPARSVPVMLLEIPGVNDVELFLAHHEVRALHAWLGLYLSDYPKE